MLDGINLPVHWWMGSADYFRPVANRAVETV